MIVASPSSPNRTPLRSCLFIVMWTWWRPDDVHVVSKEISSVQRKRKERRNRPLGKRQERSDMRVGFELGGANRLGDTPGIGSRLHQCRRFKFMEY